MSGQNEESIGGISEIVDPMQFRHGPQFNGGEFGIYVGEASNSTI